MQNSEIPTSQIPPIMPSGVEMIYSSENGHSGRGTFIKITGKTLYHENVNSIYGSREYWSVRISGDEASELYRVFVENEFDLIKRKRRAHQVFDTGSSDLILKLDENTTLRPGYADDPQLPGEINERYLAVYDAIFNLVKIYESRNPQVTTVPYKPRRAATLEEILEENQKKAAEYREIEDRTLKEDRTGKNPTGKLFKRLLNFIKSRLRMDD